VIRRVVILVSVSVAVAVAVALPLGLWRGEYQWLCAAVALALVLAPGVVALFVTERFERVSVYGPLLGLVVGTFGRVLVGFGGAVAVFLLSKPTFHADPISYWGWVLGAYLVALLIETVLLAQTRK
jgi:hypothetical protein